MEVVGLVHSCFRLLKQINLQVELQPCKMRSFSLCGEDLLSSISLLSLSGSLTCLVPHLEHVGMLLCT